MSVGSLDACDDPTWFGKSRRDWFWALRVLHVQRVSGVGGSERHLMSLLHGLQGRGIETRLCILAAPGYERLLELASERGADTAVLPAGSDVDPRLPLRIAREIRRFRADLVHSHLIHADLYGQLAARTIGFPTVSTIHSTNPFYRGLPIRWFARVAGRSARRTIAISEHVKRFVLELGIAPARSVRVVHYGIDVTEWHLTQHDRDAARARWSFGRGHVVVGVASRLVGNKGHDFLIDAFGEAHRAEPSLQLIVAGAGSARDELEARAAKTSAPSAIRFLGHVSDIRAFMGACDVLVFPSLPGFGEGFGLAALEAMAAGRPVVATSIDSLPEIVQDQTTGFLVQPWAIGDLAAALIRLARDETLREAMGKRSRDLAADRFSLDRMVSRTVGVYEEALGRQISVSAK